jgi:tetratricopeptide (TPR) repeat protein
MRQAFMADAPRQEIKLFYCYARKDKNLRDELEKHLAGLKRRYHLTNWHDREILPGEKWEQAIDKHLNSAHLILLLISPDFMASDYCYGKEMHRALERHREGTCRVVPILLRPSDWKEAPFSSLQLLPTDARPITRWSNRDEAFQNVVTEISRTINDLLISLKTKEEWIREGNVLENLNRDEEVLAAYEQAISLDPNDAYAYLFKGNTLYMLKRYEEALDAHEQVIRLDPNYADAYNNKGNALSDLKRYEEALAAYEQAIRLHPDDANYKNNKGIALENLKRHEEALDAFEQAISLDPNFALAYNNKGIALNELKRYEEALVAYEQAISLDHNFADYYHNKGTTLNDLKRYKEALAAFEQAISLDHNDAHAYTGKYRAIRGLKRA